ncbi:MAG: hypothetical protein ACFFG0_04535 [Candidatus Thorarchaeota archaeon]
MQVEDSGESESHSVMEWIQIESDEFDIIWPEKEQTSKKVLDCKIIRRIFLMEKANDGSRKTNWCYYKLRKLLEDHKLGQGRNRG